LDIPRHLRLENTLHAVPRQLPGSWTCGFQGARNLLGGEQTAIEQKMLNRGVAAGMLIGLAIGGMIALIIAARSQLFAALVQ